MVHETTKTDDGESCSYQRPSLWCIGGLPSTEFSGLTSLSGNVQQIRGKVSLGSLLGYEISHDFITTTQ